MNPTQQTVARIIREAEPRLDRNAYWQIVNTAISVLTQDDDRLDPDRFRDACYA